LTKWIGWPNWRRERAHNSQEKINHYKQIDFFLLQALSLPAFFCALRAFCGKISGADSSPRTI
jgi:hypothetical protein